MRGLLLVQRLTALAPGSYAMAVTAWLCAAMVFTSERFGGRLSVCCCWYWRFWYPAQFNGACLVVGCNGDQSCFPHAGLCLPPQHSR